MLRPFLVHHLTAKRGTKISWLPLQFLFQRWSKSDLKTKNWNHSHLLSNLAKEGVGKKFFNLSSFYIGIKFYVKVNSSLARHLQIQVGNWAQMYFLGPRPQGQEIFWDFMILIDSSHYSWENEVLFVKIEARDLDLLLDTSSGPRRPKFSF